MNACGATDGPASFEVSWTETLGADPRTEQMRLDPRHARFPAINRQRRTHLKKDHHHHHQPSFSNTPCIFQFFGSEWETEAATSRCEL